MQKQTDELLERAYKIMLQVYSHNPLTRDILRIAAADDVKREMKEWCEDYMRSKVKKEK